MFALVRRSGVLLLLLSALAGQGAVAMLLAHVAIEHAVSAPHVHHEDGHHEAEGPVESAERHHREPGHTHDLAAADHLTPARLAGATLALLPAVTVHAIAHWQLPPAPRATVAAPAREPVTPATSQRVPVLRI